MYIIGTFEYRTSLELALNDIQNKGISKNEILCIPLDKRVNSEKFFDTIHRTDGKSTIGFPFFLSTCFALFGAIYGFLWKWGPIIWGGLGFLIGISLGFFILFLLHKRQDKKIKKDNLTEVIVIIHCEDNKKDEVMKVLWEQYALGVGELYK